MNLFKMTFRRKKFLTLLAAATESLAVYMLLIISDSVIAGQMLGENAVAAIELVTPIYAVAVFLGSLFADGVATLYTVAVGEMDRKKMSRLFSEGLICVTVIGAVVFAAVSLFGHAYIDSYDVSEEIRTMAKEYLFYNVITFGITGLFLYFSEMVYADGDEKVCNISGVVNIVGNIGISILACRLWGIKGLGFGSMCGTALSMCVLVAHFFRKSNTMRISRGFIPGDLLKIVKYSFIDASGYLYQAIATVLINYIIMATVGERYLPVYSAVLSFLELECILDGIGEAATPLVNIYRGEKNLPGEKDINSYAAVWAGIEGLAFIAIIQLTAPFLPGVFGIDRSSEIYSCCVTAFRLVSIRALGTSFIYFLSSYYLVSGHILLGSVMSGLNTLAFPVTLGWILTSSLGINGLWTGYIASSVFTLLATCLYIACRYGKTAVPYMYSGEHGATYNFELVLRESEIVGLRDEVGEILDELKISRKTSYYMMLICEEVLSLIREKNAGTELYAECALTIGDTMNLVIRDGGEIFDITDADLKVTSLRSMVVSSIMEHWHNKDNMVTVSYNCNVFKLQLQDDT